jgi:hypothetical protein
MKLKGIAFGLGLALLANFGQVAFAQNELDAFRYMSPSTVGTARGMGMAGAVSAVGADFSSAYLNPAGLGLYRKSEIMASASLRIIQNDLTYLDQSSPNGYNRFGISNFAYVYADKVAKWNRETRMREEAKTGLLSYTLSLGFNQLGQFGRNTNISAYNTKSSITEYFASLANGQSVSEIEQDNGYPGQAWWAYMIDTSSTDGNYIGAANGGNVQQQVQMSEVGRLNEWTIGAAGNISDKLFVGATIGIQDLKYNQNMEISESDPHNVHASWANDSIPFSSLTFTNGFQTKGTGFNLRIGVIGKPTDFLRIGASVSTPTVLSLTDAYYSQIEGYLDNDPAAKSKDVPDGAFNYSLTTPFKATVGGMVLFGKRGFLSGDFDYLDYSTGKFKSDGKPGTSYYYSFRDENLAIQNLFSGAYNFRVGGELRFGPGRARAGFGNFSSILKKQYLSYYSYPNNEVRNLKGGKQVFSLGLGLKQKSFYLDLAFVHEVSSNRRLLYTLADPTAYSPELISKISTNNFCMTIGFTF